MRGFSPSKDIARIRELVMSQDKTSILTRSVLPLVRKLLVVEAHKSRFLFAEILQNFGGFFIFKRVSKIKKLAF